MTDPQDSIDLRDCLCADPWNCTEAIEGYRCRKGSALPSPPTRNCPRCESPAPHLHPSVQHEGEVQICPHSWHDAARAPYRSGSNQAEGPFQMPATLLTPSQATDLLQAFAERLAQSQEDLPADAARVLREHASELYIDDPPGASRTDADSAIRASMRPPDFTPDGWTLAVFGQHRDGCPAAPNGTKRHTACDCGLSQAINELNARADPRYPAPQLVPKAPPALSGETPTTPPAAGE